jgi:hypothetical protein
METGFKNDVNLSIGFITLNMSSLVDIIWYGQTKYNYHYGDYANVISKMKKLANYEFALKF